MAFLVESQDGKTKSHTDLFVNAITYLKQSSLARMMLEGMEDPSITVVVNISERKNWKNGFFRMNKQPHVKWNPTYKLKTTFQERPAAATYGLETMDLSDFLSPSLLLMHELGHAYQWLSDAKGYKKQMKRFDKAVKKKAKKEKISKSEAKERLKDAGQIVLEEANVAAVENTVAMELRGQGYPEGLRWWYADNEKKPTYEEDGGIAISHKKTKQVKHL